MLGLEEKKKQITRFQFSSSFELELLTTTSKREFLIDQLKQYSEAMQSGFAWDPVRVLQALLFTRQSSLDCVTELQRWSGATTALEEFPFDDKKTNYLLRLCRDLDFIRGMPTLRQFGFHLAAKNPFLLPVRKEHAPELVDRERTQQELDLLHKFAFPPEKQIGEMRIAISFLQSEIELRGERKERLTEWAILQWDKEKWIPPDLNPTPSKGRIAATGRLFSKISKNENAQNSYTKPSNLRIDDVLGDMTKPLDEKLPEAFKKSRLTQLRCVNNRIPRKKEMTSPISKNKGGNSTKIRHVQEKAAKSFRNADEKLAEFGYLAQLFDDCAQQRKVKPPPPKVVLKKTRRQRDAEAAAEAAAASVNSAPLRLALACTPELGTMWRLLSVVQPL